MSKFKRLIHLTLTDAKKKGTVAGEEPFKAKQIKIPLAIAAAGVTANEASAFLLQLLMIVKRAAQTDLPLQS